MQSIEPELDKIRVFICVDYLDANFQFSEDFNEHVRLYHPNEELTRKTIMQYVKEYVSVVYESIYSEINLMHGILIPSDLVAILKVISLMPAYDAVIENKQYTINQRQFYLPAGGEAVESIYTVALENVPEELKSEYEENFTVLFKDFMINHIPKFKTKPNYLNFSHRLDLIFTKYSSVMSATEIEFLEDLNRSFNFYNDCITFIRRNRIINVYKISQKYYYNKIEQLLVFVGYVMEHPDDFIEDLCIGIKNEKIFGDGSVIKLTDEIQEKITKYSLILQIEQSLHSLNTKEYLKCYVKWIKILSQKTLSLFVNDSYFEVIFETEIGRMRDILNLLVDQNFLIENTTQNEYQDIILKNDDFFNELEPIINEIVKVLITDRTETLLK